MLETAYMTRQINAMSPLSSFVGGAAKGLAFSVIDTESGVDITQVLLA